MSLDADVAGPDETTLDLEFAGHIVGFSFELDRLFRDPRDLAERVDEIVA